MTYRDEDWAFEEAEARSPVRGRRSVVSVAFPAQDFERVARYAEAFGMKLSEFIREAAIEKTQPKDTDTTMLVAGGGGSCVMFIETKVSPITRVATFVSEPELEAVSA